jgi:hypothetical protein
VIGRVGRAITWLLGWAQALAVVALIVVFVIAVFARWVYPG